MWLMTINADLRTETASSCSRSNKCVLQGVKQFGKREYKSPSATTMLQRTVGAGQEEEERKKKKKKKMQWKKKKKKKC